MKKILSLILIVSLMILSWSGCKDCDDPSNIDCGNYDPCHDKQPANADFGIYELFDLRERGRFENETDTVLPGFTGVLFKPKHKNDKVTWYLGSEVLEQTQVVRSLFPPNKTISVTMIAEKNQNDCLNVEELRDTVTKEFFCKDIGDFYSFVENAIKMPFWGTWEGYLTDAPNEKFIVTFGHIFKNWRPELQFQFALAGLPKGLPLQPDSNVMSSFIPFFKVSHIGYHMMYGSGGAFNLKAFFTIKDHTLTIEHSYNETPYLQYLLGESQQEYRPEKLVTKTFIGKKLSNELKKQ